MRNNYAFTWRKGDVITMLCKYSEGKICDGCMWCYDTDYKEDKEDKEEMDMDIKYKERDEHI